MASSAKVGAVWVCPAGRPLERLGPPRARSTHGATWGRLGLRPRSKERAMGESHEQPTVEQKQEFLARWQERMPQVLDWSDEEILFGMLMGM